MTGYSLDKDSFQLALGLIEPWYINEIIFSHHNKRLDIYVDFVKGSKFSCPTCGSENCNVHDTKDKEWRHLDFFQYPSYIHARSPRIECPNCGVLNADIPWSRKMSSFTRLFESIIVLMAQDMQVNAVAKRVHEQDTRVWRIIKFYVKEALKNQDFSQVTAVCIDETSERKGHKYITVFADKKSGKVLFVCKGKDSRTVGSFFIEFLSHHGNPKNITQACCDMSPAFILGITEFLENAHIIFDKFHVMQLVNKAVDAVRRAEQIYNSLLNKTRYIWLKGVEKLTEKQKELLGSLRSMNLKNCRAYQMKLNLQYFWGMQERDLAHKYLKKWYFWLTHSKLEPMISLTKTIKQHWEGILNYFDFRVTNGLMEGLNSIIQSLKRSARGYRNSDNFITMIYLRCGFLKFNLPT